MKKNYLLIAIFFSFFCFNSLANNFKIYTTSKISRTERTNPKSIPINIINTLVHDKKHI